jgi:TrmH family RNA methyltransferase
MLTKSQVKYIQSLNQKKLRQENGAFVAEGPKILNELLATKNIEPLAIYGTAAWWRENDDLRNEIPFVAFHEISDAELERISFLSHPNQVLAVFKLPAVNLHDLENRVSVLLDDIQDPGNFGTIIRIADWFKVDHIIASPASADAFNPKVVQASMGSISRVNIAYEPLDAFLDRYKAVDIYAATLDGMPLQSFSKITSGFLMIGNESKGISSEFAQRAQHRLTIPRYGAAESLNAAVATGIILSHLL